MDSEYLFTLNEFIEKNKKNPKYKQLIDDFYEFPEDESLFSMRIKFEQRINDIVIFHRYVVLTYNNNKKILNPIFSEFNKHYSNAFDAIKPEEKHFARLSFKNYNWKEEQEQAKIIANESLVINLWTTVEQYTNRCLLFVDNNNQKSYRWDIIKSKFEKKEINLSNISSYSTIDELRVLNNKIKHLYVVDTQLAKFDNFKDHVNKELNYVPFKLEDYIVSTYHFIYKLINSLGNSVQY